ncbi:hypothetical protein DFP72DRAFT_1086703 [Ephemerocybe angulata]|uniref:Uncharacterized protein n=1 Tax=Ephemerocybe angulata TaxID=980116 RepID=A0A8H6H5K1_9AGAR|nr:hypothetical protein DFP72DRAFT_1086703 [Tulosesus angulatus]
MEAGPTKPASPPLPILFLPSLPYPRVVAGLRPPSNIDHLADRSRNPTRYPARTPWNTSESRQLKGSHPSNSDSKIENGFIRSEPGLERPWGTIFGLVPSASNFDVEVVEDERIWQRGSPSDQSVSNFERRGREGKRARAPSVRHSTRRPSDQPMSNVAEGEDRRWVEGGGERWVTGGRGWGARFGDLSPHTNSSNEGDAELLPPPQRAPVQATQSTSTSTGTTLASTTQNLSTNVVHISDGTEECKTHALLLNAHLDSTLSSPGTAG